MGQRVTLGGDRLGSGKKQKVDTQTFNRSTHDLGYILRTTMSAGTLVPFMCEVALPGDNFDIDLGCEVLTLPTVGPLFGSMKVQLDVFLCPVRLYQGQLHNNKLGIGLNMAAVKLPVMTLQAPFLTPEELAEVSDPDNYQINPSCIFSYLGIRGVGVPVSAGDPTWGRDFNAVPFLAYWDIFKNYYANKQEDNAWVIHTPPVVVPNNVTSAEVDGSALPQYPTLSGGLELGLDSVIGLVTTATQPPDTIMIGLQSLTTGGTIEWRALNELTYITFNEPLFTEGSYLHGIWGTRTARAWRYRNNSDLVNSNIELTSFPLENIDSAREAILSSTLTPTPFNISELGIPPYSLIFAGAGGLFQSYTGSQEGLAVKTYQSDLFNNWLNTEYIDGVNGIAAVTAVSTTGDEFTIDSLILHKKVYDMLNDVLVSGGSYDDWQAVVYDHKSIGKAESPIYYGSLIKELQFQEVISNSESSAGSGGVQPLGTLAGRGRLGQKHKGGTINVKVDEIGYLIGIMSITPRIDYSQGNEWHVHLETMDDFHKPHMDEIGFQELITEQLAWWDTAIDTLGNAVQVSAGKQPAWLNYMTNVNKIKGNFAIANDSMFMTLARRYQSFVNASHLEIQDLTTYINPSHFNHIFAQTSLDSQNYWVQVGVDMKARRKMSARVMPNL